MDTHIHSNIPKKVEHSNQHFKAAIQNEDKSKGSLNLEIDNLESKEKGNKEGEEVK